jgi:PAS domain S-box-containing protein
MSLQRLKWLTAILVTAFLLIFEYLRHFVWPGLLHTFPAYLISVAAVFLIILLFNRTMFGILERMQQSVMQQNRRLATLNAIASTVSQTLNLDQTLDQTLDQVIDHTGVDAAAIHLVEGDHLRLVVSRNLAPDLALGVDEIKIGEGLSGRVAATGQPIVVQDNFSQDERVYGPVRPYHFESFACVPLSAQGKVVGVMPMATYQRRVFSPEDMELLAAIGKQVGVAIENARLHAEVRRQAGYLNTVIESSGNAIITLNREGTILTWNHAAETIYGWNREEAIGQTLPMVPPHLLEEARAMVARMEAGETMRNVETQRLRKDGTLIPVMVTASPIVETTGKTINMLGVSTDMREQKRLEQELLHQQSALAVLQERERLARELHDSLGQILGYVNTQTQAARQVLAQGQVEVADGYLKELTRVAQDAHADVREYILSLQTNASREQQFLPTLRAYLHRFRQSSGIDAELVADDDPRVALAPAVETQLMSIVQEALTNVRKHAAARQVRVTFQIVEGRAQVQIADDGKGFDPSELAAHAGLHFGQRIMRERAAEIGGTIETQSSAGKGTRIIVTAPLGGTG